MSDPTIYRTFETMQVIQDHDKPPVTVEIHRRIKARDLIAEGWNPIESDISGYYNGMMIYQNFIEWADMPVAYGVRIGNGQVLNVDLDAEIILSYREPSVWLRLTDEARAVLLEVARQDSATFDYTDSKALFVGLEDAGFINWYQDDYRQVYYFLTYQGARIIPVSEVEGGE